MIEEGSDNSVGITELLSYTMLSLDLLSYLEDTKFSEGEIEVFSKFFQYIAFGL